MSMSTKEQRRKWAKQRIDALKAMKRCVDCGKQDAYTLSGRCRCAECTEKNRQSALKWHHEHPEEAKARIKNFYEKRKANRICVMCGNPLPPERKAFACKRCSAKYTEYKRQEMLRKNKTTPRYLFIEQHPDLCTRCRKAPRYKNYKLCKACYNHNVSASHKAAEIRHQNEEENKT